MCNKRTSGVVAEPAARSTPEFALLDFPHHSAQDSLRPVSKRSIGRQVRPRGAALRGVDAPLTRSVQARGNLLLEIRFQFPVLGVHTGEVLVQRVAPSPRV